MFDIVLSGLVIALFLVVVVFQFRFYVLRFRSRNWPTATAIIAMDFVGTISRGAGAGFFRYVFTVDGAEYLGRFILPDSWEHAETLQRKLDGCPILIKFLPTNPKISLLVSARDSMFEARVATQNPYWYMNARDKGSMLTLDLNKK